MKKWIQELGAERRSILVFLRGEELVSALAMSTNTAILIKDHCECSCPIPYEGQVRQERPLCQTSFMLHPFNLSLVTLEHLCVIMSVLLVHCSFSCRISRFGEDYPLPPENFSFQIRVEVEIRRVLRSIQHLLVEYRDSHRGPTAMLLQTSMGK